MPFMMPPSRFHVALVGIFSLVASLSLSGLVQAEPRAILAEATYIMGDGETPDFAEARALQKAKQSALEEAGTYVQSYTKVQNLDLTTEEIQTIAGGVLQVEVLEKTRSLVTDGLRVYTKIRATVTTDKMEELVRRIKDKNVAEEYTKLQAEYARLSQELEVLKQNAAKTPKGLERNAALDQIREGEKAFARVQQREADLFQRLVSGKQLVANASHDKEIIDELLQTIATSGYIVTVGNVQSVADSEKPDMLVLKVPLTIRLSETVPEAVSHAVNALDGTMQSDVDVRLNGKLQTKTRSQATDLGDIFIPRLILVRIGKHPETARYFQDGVAKLALLVTFLNGTSELSHCFLSHSNWFHLRRIFPIFSTRFVYGQENRVFGGIGITAIDNGRYEAESTRGNRRDLNLPSSGYIVSDRKPSNSSLGTEQEVTCRSEDL